MSTSRVLLRTFTFISRPVFALTASTAALALALAALALAAAIVAASWPAGPASASPGNRHQTAAARSHLPLSPSGAGSANARPAAALGSTAPAVLTLAGPGIPVVAGASRAMRAQAIAWNMLPKFSWQPKSQFRYLKWLWDRESSWNIFATNPYSGAYGIPQAVPGSKMASAGRNWRTSPWVQIRWGLRYIRSRYGSPRAAWDHEAAFGWY